MNKPSPLIVYKASAGSGKTFTLTAEYIELLVQNPRAYQHILAVTFTNKATGELKQRILTHLYGLAHGCESSNGYLKVLKEKTGITDATLIQQRCEEALSLIIHDYSRFQITTLDSFFQRILTALARELKLAAHLTIDIDTDTARTNAVNEMLAQLQNGSKELTWILDMINEKIDDNKKWEVAQSLTDFSKHLFNEQYEMKGEALRQSLSNDHQTHFVDNYKNELHALHDNSINELTQKGELFFNTLEAHELDISDMAYGKTGVASYFLKLSKQDANMLVTDKMLNSRTLTAMNNADGWCSKSHKRKDEIRTLAQSTLIPLLQQTEQLRRQNAIIINTCNLCLQNIDKLRLLNSISQQMVNLNEENDTFLLANTNALLNKFIQDDDTPFIYEKIGSTLSHLMIDEFQDTSTMQFNNLMPLLAQSAAEGNKSIIVGDVKQSIYRWRNGDWHLLAHIEQNPNALQTETVQLQNNWRSQRRIIQFNNELFKNILPQIQQEAKAEAEDGNTQGIASIQQAYSDVKQLSPKQTEAGLVDVLFLNTAQHPDEDDSTEEKADANTLMLQQVEKTLRHLVETEKMDCNQIAILCRKNKHTQSIAAHLKEHYPQLPIVSAEAFLLSSSRMVQLIIEAMRMLVEPQPEHHTSLLCATLALHYQQLLKTDVTIQDVMQNGNPMDQLPPHFMEQKELLTTLPLTELTERIYEIFQLQRIEGEENYLFAFFDSIMEFLNANPSSIPAFLNQWNATLSKRKVPVDKANGVQLLSIHKSKGLEFKTVIVPFCDWSIFQNDEVWCTPPSNTLFAKVAPLPIMLSKKAAESFFMDDYYKEHTEQIIDNLNLLYVAFTRAENNLFILGYQPAVNKRGEEKQDGVSHWLLHSLPDVMKEVEDEAGPHYVYGSLLKDESAQSTAKATVSQPNLLETLPKEEDVAMRLTHQSVSFRQSNQSAAFVAQPDDPDALRNQYIQNGKLMHRVFSLIRTAADVHPTLLRMQMDGCLTAQQLPQMEDVILKALSIPQAQEWFNNKWQVYNERSIICGNSTDGHRRPDRVMTHGTHAIVVDFKFGKPHASYEEQVREYIHLLHELGYTQVEGYLWYIYQNRIQPVGETPQPNAEPTLFNLDTL